MDFLTPIIAQVRELFASMTPGARVTAGLLLAVVVVSLGFLFQQATGGPDAYLFGGDPIASDRISRIESAIAAANVEFTTDGNRIKVSPADKNAALAAVSDANELPPEFFSAMSSALNGGGMFEPRPVKEARLQAAREKQASVILNKYPWVDSAHVMLSIRQQSGLGARRKASAAVALTPAVGESVSTKRIRNVKSFVSKACDVPIEHVEVTNLGGDAFADDGGQSPDDFDEPRYKLKMQLERQIRDAIQKQLRFIKGALVEVKAEIDDTQQRRTVTVKPEEPGVALTSSKLTDSSKQSIARPGDRVGATANGPEPASRDEQLARQDQSEQMIDKKDQEYVVGSNTTETTSAGYALKEADASIGVPYSYVEEVYRQDNLDEEGNPPEQIDRDALAQTKTDVKTMVEELVQPLLPRLSLGENEFRQVNVQFFREPSQKDLPAPSVAAEALAWTGQYANTLMMLGLAVFSLVMLRSMVNSTGKDGPVGGLPSLQLDGETLAEAANEDDDDPPRPKLKLRRADTLKDDLNDMVSSDPDAAAAILKSWINNAA